MTRIDARGMRCPWPALRLAKAMRSAGEVMIFADDPAAPAEIGALAVAHGWTVVAKDASFHVVSGLA